MIDSISKTNFDLAEPRFLQSFDSECFERLLRDLPDASLVSSISLIYRCLANQHRFDSCNEVIANILTVVKHWFSVEDACVLRQIAEETAEVLACSCAADDFFVGQHLPCRELDKFMPTYDDGLVIRALPFLTNRIFPGRLDQKFETRCGIAIKMEWNISEPVIICLVSDSSLNSKFSEDGRLLLELTAEGIACMMELQKVNNPRKRDDLALYASGSIKTLDEYRTQAELPEGLGVPGKVVTALQRRIGELSLSIDNIADDLNLSKRTLQRRLQQHGISFAELRDKVRFHVAIDMLVKEQTSIDRISATLDFSDRTSFTNAFKRWTGLSPSTFRKVFRDYA